MPRTLAIRLLGLKSSVVLRLARLSLGFVLVQSPRATQKEIKQAYYNIMRSCHPDVAGASMSADEEDDGSADDVCAFINAAVMEVQSSLNVPLPSSPSHFLADNHQTVPPLHDLLSFAAL